MKPPQIPENAPAPSRDEVRVLRREPPHRRAPRWILLLLLAVGTVAGYRMTRQASRNASAAAPQHTPQPLPPPGNASRVPRDAAMPSRDPDDVSRYISPAARAPAMAEVIEALHDAGVNDGIAAFNPPGTRPPLPGLAVPEDFELPKGYVRHYQVTDEGEPIAPILMFSPDFELLDASGRPVELPPNRVVPPELAPPGLPNVPVRIPSP